MIKPEFFDDPVIAELTPFARLFFIGLWLQADRAGRLPDDIRRLKARIFPYDSTDTEALAAELQAKDLIRRYSGSDGKRYIWIRTFVKHQRPHPKEPQSLIPDCPSEDGKINGEPCLKTEGTPESGFLILDSGTRNLDQKIKAVPAALSQAQPVEKSQKNIRIITKLAHEVLRGHNGDKPTGADLCEEIKTLCATRRITYDAAVVRKALDSAEVQRRVNRA